MVMQRRRASHINPRAAQKGSHVVLPICCLLLAVHLQPSGWAAAYLMPLGVAVQNIVGPSSPLKAVQVHIFTTEDFVCDVKQYLHASTTSLKGPSDIVVRARVAFPGAFA